MNRTDRALKWFAIGGSWAAGFIAGMWMSEARAQECTIADPQSITYEWIAPTENKDGSPLTNLDGYFLYYGTASGNYDQQVDIPDAGLTTYVLECLPPNTTVYAVMTSYNADGLESDTTSNEVSDTTGATVNPPNPPANLVVRPDNLKVYSVEKSHNFIATIHVGSVPEGTECDGTQPVKGFYVVPVEAVTFTDPNTEAEVVVAQCQPGS